MSVHTAWSVAALSDTVPANRRARQIFRRAREIRKTRTSSGRRSMARDRTPALMAASTHTGRCGPCARRRQRGVSQCSSRRPSPRSPRSSCPPTALREAFLTSGIARRVRRGRAGHDWGASRRAIGSFVLTEPRRSTEGASTRACAMVVGARRSRTRDGDSARYLSSATMTFTLFVCDQKQILERSLIPRQNRIVRAKKYPSRRSPPARHTRRLARGCRPRSRRASARVASVAYLLADAPAGRPLPRGVRVLARSSRESVPPTTRTRG